MLLFTGSFLDGSGGSGSTFPQVQTNATSTEESATSQHDISMPSGIVSGDLLFAFATLGATAINPLDTPSGWRQLFHIFDASSCSAGYYRIADGTEGAGIQLQTYKTDLSAHVALRVSTVGGPPEVAASSGGSTSTPDPGSLAPSWGARDNLWLIFEGHRNSSITVTPSSGYGSAIAAATGSPTNSTDHARATVAQKALNASSDDPGVVTLSATANPVVATIAVAPTPPLTASPFPQVKETKKSTDETTVTSHTVLLPDNYQAGDLLIIAITLGGASTTISTPGGWSPLFSEASTNRTSAGFYKVASGSEGASVAVTSAAARKSAHQAFRITNYQGTPEATSTNAAATTQDPPSLSPSWGSDDTLWIAYAGWRNSQIGVEGLPANYTDLRFTFTGSPTNSTDEATCVSMVRELAASSENPPAFSTGATSVNSCSATIAIRGA